MTLVDGLDKLDKLLIEISAWWRKIGVLGRMGVLGATVRLMIMYILSDSKLERTEIKLFEILITVGM